MRLFGPRRRKYRGSIATAVALLAIAFLGFWHWYPAWFEWIPIPTPIAWLFPSSPPASEVNRDVERVSQLSQQISQLDQQDSQKISQLTQRVAELESEVHGIKIAPTAAAVTATAITTTPQNSQLPPPEKPPTPTVRRPPRKVVPAVPRKMATVKPVPRIFPSVSGPPVPLSVPAVQLIQLPPLAASWQPRATSDPENGCPPDHPRLVSFLGKPACSN